MQEQDFEHVMYDGEAVMMVERRTLIKSAALALGVFTLAPATMAEAALPRQPDGRELMIYNAHTSRKFKGEYWYKGKYLPDAFREIKDVLKDHRTGEKYPIDPRLMDVLYVLDRRIGKGQGSFEIFSGYRSPQTNAKLRKMSTAVAKESLHMQGQAVDLRLPGTKLSALREAAISLKAGGVGYYPKDNFVHIDTGRVRYW